MGMGIEYINLTKNGMSEYFMRVFASLSLIYFTAAAFVASGFFYTL